MKLPKLLQLMVTGLEFTASLCSQQCASHCDLLPPSSPFQDYWWSQLSSEVTLCTLSATEAKTPNYYPKPKERADFRLIQTLV